MAATAARRSTIFLTDPTYRGDTHYPMYDRIDPDWKVGRDDMEQVSEKERASG
jgi:hypothetical protein